MPVINTDKNLDLHYVCTVRSNGETEFDKLLISPMKRKYDVSNISNRFHHNLYIALYGVHSLDLLSMLIIHYFVFSITFIVMNRHVKNDIF